MCLESGVKRERLSAVWSAAALGGFLANRSTSTRVRLDCVLVHSPMAVWVGIPVRLIESHTPALQVDRDRRFAPDHVASLMPSQAHLSKMTSASAALPMFLLTVAALAAVAALVAQP